MIVLRVETDAPTAAAIAARLEAEESPLTTWSDVETGRTDAVAYVGDGADPDAAESDIAEWLAARFPPGAWRLRRETLPDRDWQEEWKRWFRSARASPRIVIAPPWEAPPAPRGGHVVTIDPGMSFGTGRHATTRACLRRLDALAAARPGASFCDAGCGSGILAIAAARLGCRPVVALDHDPVAVESARRNAAANGVGDAVDVRLDDLSRAADRGRFEVVAANLLSGEHLAFRAAIVALLAPAPESRLLVAGTLRGQHAEVRDAYMAAGLREIESRREGRWVSAAFGAA
jgi:ribosomal protein L11 methyltransferase